VADVTDEQLISQYRQAAVDARPQIAEELFARHYERVARWCVRFTGDREAAADLAQDVFLKAYKNLDGFKGASQFSTWLYSIMRHEALNRVQRAPRESQSDDSLREVAAAVEGPEEALVRHSRNQRVMTFLSATLEPIERRVFTLHYGAEMPLEAITRLLGLDNASGAKAYIVSAKRKIARATERLRARGERWSV
jgi:RNA polymerase sigma-70 factor (ECF subfamily)